MVVKGTKKRYTAWERAGWGLGYDNITFNSSANTKREVSWELLVANRVVFPCTKSSSAASLTPEQHTWHFCLWIAAGTGCKLTGMHNGVSQLMVWNHRITEWDFQMSSSPSPLQWIGTSSIHLLKRSVSHTTSFQNLPWPWADRSDWKN